MMHAIIHAIRIARERKLAEAPAQRDEYRDEHKRPPRHHAAINSGATRDAIVPREPLAGFVLVPRQVATCNGQFSDEHLAKIGAKKTF